MLSNIEEESFPLPVIFSLSGPKLTKEEKEFFKDSNPLGFILFKRNCENPEQLKKLVKSLHDCMGREVPVLIDQEGGRVQRMRAPEWTDYKPAKHYGDAFMRNFAKGREALEEDCDTLAGELAEHGVNVNCAPVLDVLHADTHDAIGDRAFSNDPEMVAALGGTVCKEFLAKGVVPVVKHIPGQGRAKSDSHVDLPVVDAPMKDLDKSDFAPFRDILSKSWSEAVWGMVSHIIYKDIDERTPASCSRRVIFDVIRGKIGFQNLLLSDDIGMGALESMGSAAHRAEKVIRAGCDIALHCNGDLEEMKAIAKRIPKMTDETAERYNRTVNWMGRNLG